MPLPSNWPHGMRPARQGEVITTIDDHPSLPSHLERALTEAIQQKIEALISAKDWPDYEKRRGEINGLKLAISLCQDTEKQLKA